MIVESRGEESDDINYSKQSNGSSMTESLPEQLESIISEISWILKDLSLVNLSEDFLENSKGDTLTQSDRHRALRDELTCNVFIVPDYTMLAAPGTITDQILAQYKSESLLIFVARIYGRECRVLIDCGSSKDFISRSWVEQHAIPQVKIDNPFSVGLVNNAKLICNTMIERVPIKFRRNFDDRRSLHVLDMNSKSFDAILGQPFLCSRNPKIDWRQRTMKLQKQHTHGVNMIQQECFISALPVDRSYAVIPSRPLHQYDKDYHSRLALALDIIDAGKHGYDIKASEIESVNNMQFTRSAIQRCRRRQRNDIQEHAHHDIKLAYQSQQVRVKKIDFNKFSDYQDFQRHIDNVSLQDGQSFGRGIISRDTADDAVHQHHDPADESAAPIGKITDDLDIVTSKQMVKYMRKLRANHKQQDIRCYVCTVSSNGQVNFSQDLSDTPDVEPMETPDYSYGTPEHHEVAKRLTKKLYDKYSHICKVKLPPGIPPVRFEGGECSIDLTEEGKTSSPPSQRARAANQEQLAELKKQMEYYLKSDFWRPSASPYAAPILFVPKLRDDGSFDGWRLCCDYRGINNLTRRDSFPLPPVESLIEAIGSSKYFAKIDLTQFFHQIPMKPADIEKTAINTRYGLFEWTIMPFGLTNAPAISVRFGNRVFHDMLDKYMVIFLDDILVYANTIDDLYNRLDAIFARMEEMKLYFHPGKSKLFLTKVAYLGLGLAEGGTHIMEHRIKAIQDWPIPTRADRLSGRATAGRPSRAKDEKAGIRSFLGVVGFFRKFIKGFAAVAKPITDILQEQNEFCWGDAQQNAFDELKRLVTEAPLLITPVPGLRKMVIPDASEHAIGGVLLQETEKGSNVFKPCAYLSYKLNQTHARWSPYEIELWAMVRCLQIWRHHLVGYHFTVRSDHAPLKHFHSQKHVTDKLARWLDFLSEFDFTVEHIPGKDNTAADGLSRRQDHISDSVDSNTLLEYLYEYFDSTNVIDLATSDGWNTYIHNPDVDYVCEQCIVTEDVAQDDTSILVQSIKRAYKQDSYIEHIKSNPDPDAYSNKMVEINGLWYRIKPDKTKALYVPRCNVKLRGNLSATAREALMYESHNALIAGHLGEARMYRLMQRDFWWADMRKDIKQYVRSCPDCQRNKTRHGRIIGPFTPNIPPKTRWSEVSLDFITKLPLTLNGLYDSILVIMDATSKRVHLVPMMEKGFGAKESAEVFFREIFRLHGLPDVILSDRDPRFTSAFWQELIKLCGTSLSLTAAYHSSSNPSNERVHKVIEELLRTVTQYPPMDWDIYLPATEFAVNNADSLETGYSPFELDTGQHPRDPRLLWTKDLIHSKEQPDVETMLRTWRNMVSRSVKVYKEARMLAKEKADRFRRSPDFVIGDKVMLRTTFLNWPGVDLLGKHFKPPQVGPFEVIGMNRSKTNVTLRWNKPGIRVHPVQPINRVYKYTEDTSALRRQLTQPEEPPPIGADSDEYIIEKLLKRRRIRNSTRYEYLVNWKGYSSFHNLWIPEEELKLNAKKLIENYDKKFPRESLSAEPSRRSTRKSS